MNVFHNLTSKKKLKKFFKKTLKYTQKNIRILGLISVLLICSFLLTFFFFLDKKLHNEIGKIILKSSPIVIPAQADYPEFTYPDSDNKIPDISAHAAIVLDDSSKVILFAKNRDIVFPMASTTKIMTALTALEYFHYGDIVTVYPDALAVPPAVVGVQSGEQFSFEDMLYGMMVSSGNDAARVIAQNYPGGEQAFIQKMNENALKNYLFNTHYDDVSGLSQKNVTTVFDLARLTSIAMKNPVFAEVVSTKNKTITSINTKKTYSFSNLNRLLGHDGVTGVKTGFTAEAGEVLVTSRVENDHLLIFVVMKSLDRFDDTKKLLNIVRGNLSYLKFNN